MMEMEADRMRQPAPRSEETWTPNAQVILEERNQRTDNEPGALLREQRSAAQYMNHPYGIPIIGWRHEMEGLSLEDAKAFYRQHYAPNNAILIVAGDVEPDRSARWPRRTTARSRPTPTLDPARPPANRRSLPNAG